MVMSWLFYFLGVVSVRTCSVAGFGEFASWDDEPPRLFLRCGAAHGRAWPSA
jgi:hypothetical protein